MFKDTGNVILSFANKLLVGEKPENWSGNDLIPLPKAGDLGRTEIYRGISLLVLLKIW